MTRFRSLAAAVAAALLAGLAAVAPPATAAEHTMTLSGSRSAYVDVTLFGPQFAPATYASRGRFAGYFIEPLFDTGMPPSLLDQHHVGEVLLRDLPGGEPLFLTPNRALRAQDGAQKYRVYLIADGPTTVTIPLMGADRSYNLKPRKPVRAAVAVAKLRAGAGVVRGSQPLTLGRRSVSLSAVAVTAPAGDAARITACVERAGTRDCGDPVAAADTPYVEVTAPEGDRTRRGHSPELGVGGGRSAAVQEVWHAAAVRSAVGAGFTLSLA